jgi:hypothetical protein
MFAVKDTGFILLVNDPKIPDRFVLWVQFVEGLLSLIAIICLVLALAFPKFGTILGPAAAIVFAITGFLCLSEGIEAFVANNRSWAYGINLIAVCLIILGLAAGLVEYAWLLKQDIGEKDPKQA